MSNEKKKLLLVDGHSILNRAFYGMPDLTNSKGLHTGAVYGFLNILFSQLDELKPDYLTVAFDVHAPTFRHDTYAEYKGTRKGMPEELREQVPLMKKMLTAMGIEIREQAGLEADDILGTLAKKAEAQDMDVVILSGDRDLLQIATDNITIRIPRTRGGQTVIDDFRTDQVIEAYGVTPRQFIDVKALMGDSSDNIPGVPKVGEKTAISLIKDYGSVDGVYRNIDEIKKPALHKNLAENEDKARMSLFLVTIKTDCDVELELEKALADGYYTRQAFELCTELGFKNFLSRFERDVIEEKEEKTELRIIRDSADLSLLQDTILAGIKDVNACPGQADGKSEPYVVGIWPVQDRAGYGMKEETVLLGAAVAFEDRGEGRTAGSENCFIQVGDRLSAKNLCSFLKNIRLAVRSACTDQEVKDPDSSENSQQADPEADSIGIYLETPEKQKEGADKEKAVLALFSQKEHMALWGIDPAAEFQDKVRMGGIMDLLVCCYLANPLKNDYEIEDVASEYLGQSLQTRKQLFNKKSWSEAMADEADAVITYACRAAQTLQKTALIVREKLADLGMWSLYTQMERPLTFVLSDMESLGIRIQPEALKAYSESLGGRIKELEQQIYKETGETFNIASPKQLGEILFEKMGLPGGKKTKTGYSTAAGVLEKLAPEYPVVNDILEYRGLTKLRSTYAEGLMAYVADDQRIHTTLNQTITATGRISSTDPNLQNIPMKTDLGRQIRKAFVPCEEYTFTDADYSQIELRILAHMSGDQGLIDAYKENEDIHRITASKVFHTPFEEVTPLQRRNAKAVNFGIVYGISSFGLSQGLSISRAEAAEYIKAYFKTYPGIKTFLDNLVSSAKTNGYALTMYGRRRPVPELTSSNFMQRSFGERVAMNSPIQGSAADIMKIAMIRVWERILREKLQSRLILQIHDELLIETAPGEEDQVRAILKQEMEKAAVLSVSLETDIHNGTDWYLAK